MQAMPCWNIPALSSCSIVQHVHALQARILCFLRGVFILHASSRGAVCTFVCKPKLPELPCWIYLILLVCKRFLQALQPWLLLCCSVLCELLPMSSRNLFGCTLEPGMQGMPSWHLLFPVAGILCGCLHQVQGRYIFRGRWSVLCFFLPGLPSWNILSCSGVFIHADGMQEVPSWLLLRDDRCPLKQHVPGLPCWDIIQLGGGKLNHCLCGLPERLVHKQAWDAGVRAVQRWLCH